MSIEEIIAQEVRKAVEPLEQQIEKLTKELAPLHTLERFILIRQKDLPDVKDTSARTISSGVSKGAIPVLAADGSRKNYVTLGTATNLKVRRKSRKVK